MIAVLAFWLMAIAGALGGRPPRRFARTKAEAVRLGIPPWYEARRSKTAAAERGVSQSVLRGHARSSQGEIPLAERNRQARANSTAIPKGLGPRRDSTARSGMHAIFSAGEMRWVYTTRAQASLLGRYWAAVAEALESGDEAVMAPFVGVIVNGHELTTDLHELEAASRAGEVL